MTKTSVELFEGCLRLYVCTTSVGHITRQEENEMNRSKGLGIGLALAALMVVGLACGAGETQDPAQDQPGPSGSPGENTPPAISGGAPLVSLTYEGAIYHPDPLSTVEAANLNEDELELVGVTTESNRLAPGSGESLDIYRLKKNEDGYVYTLETASSFQDEGEDWLALQWTDAAVAEIPAAVERADGRSSVPAIGPVEERSP